ncbi:MAG: FAD-dependent oxidoreductase [Deltaproteobacteria bacterium]|nr:FAD-dependent oxidoreductase [Deltaproteobacteria bacterium]
MKRGRVVILGGGFGGLAAARSLEDNLDVTLIDRQPHFEFLPNIHEIVSGRQSITSVQLPRQRIVHELGHQTRIAEAQAIDLARRQVELPDGPLPYDVLILAPGAETRLEGTPGVAEHAAPIRSAQEAAVIRDRLEQLVKAGAPARVVIVGGGLTGVEVLGEILRRHKKQVHLDLALIEPNSRLLPGWPKVLHKRIKKLAERAGVQVILGARVAAVEADRLHLDNGRCLSSALTIWAAGTRAPQVLLRSGLSSGKTGPVRGLMVNTQLQLPAYPEVFVIGDAAAPPGKVKKQAAQALLLGERAAKNATRFLEQRPLSSFVKEPLPVLLTFGDLSTFVIFDDDRVVEGRALAVGRDLSFQVGMAELDRLASKGSLRRLDRRLWHAKALAKWERQPWRVPQDLADLRLHEP